MNLLSTGEISELHTNKDFYVLSLLKRKKVSLFDKPRAVTEAQSGER